MNFVSLNMKHHVKVKFLVSQLHDGAAPPSSVYKTDVIANILIEHKQKGRARPPWIKNNSA